VSGNKSTTEVVLAPAVTVIGNMAVETSSSETVDFSGVAVNGDSSVTANGATTLMGQTAGGSTEVTLVNGPASMTAMLPAGSFTTPVQYALHQVTGSDLDPQAGSSGATVDPVTAYQLSFDAVSLNEPASVSFEIMLDQLPEADRMSLLAALDDHLLTLAVKGDQPGSQYLLFGLAPEGTDPILDQTVRLLAFDAQGMLLPLDSMTEPALLRFEALVSHFSTYAVASFTPVPEPGAIALLWCCLPLLAWPNSRVRQSAGKCR
jgi:hypothetical protein